MISLPSCNNSDEPVKSEIKERHYNLNSGVTTRIIGDNLSNLEWISDDELIASVTEDGNIKANLIGFVQVHANNMPLPVLHITVEPKIKAYSEPVIWYSSGALSCQESPTGPHTFQGNLLLGMKLRGSMNLQHYGAGVNYTKYKQNGNTEIYKTGNPKSPYVAYIFDDDDKLTAAATYVEYNYTSYLPEYLNERFVVYSVDSNNLSADFASANKRTGEDVRINYIGRAWYDYSSKFLIIMHYDIAHGKSRDEYCNELINQFEIAAKALL